MPPPDNIPESTVDYYNALLSARDELFAGRGSPRVALEALYRAYGRALSDIQNDILTGQVTGGRADALSRQIKARMSQLADQMGGIVDNQVRRSMETIVEAHRRGTLSALEAADVNIPIEVAWDRVPDKALEAMNVKRGLPSGYDYRTLMRRKITNLQDEVDDFVQSVVARGASADRASTELATMMAGENDEILNILNRTDNLDLDEGQLARSFATGDLDSGEYRQIQRLLYDARRIVISEVNTGFREADTVASYHSPVVGYLQWTLSGRHGSIGHAPDICDIYAETDQFDLEAGVYPIENFPASAHPFCGCYSQKVFREPSEWIQPTPAAQQPPELQYSQFEQMFSDKTSNSLQRQVDMANHWNRQAYQYAQERGLGL